MVALLDAVDTSLAFVDAHASDVAGLGKVDIIGMPRAMAKTSTVSAHTAAIVIELKRRYESADSTRFAFTDSDKGQVLDRLARMRSVRPNGPLFGMLSNGYHVMYFKLEGSPAADVLHETQVYTLGERGLLKAVLKLAHDALVGGDLAFFKQLPEEYRKLRVASRLGAGSQCEVWELAKPDEDSSCAVVVAKNAVAAQHLHHSVSVLRALRSSLAKPAADDDDAATDGGKKRQQKKPKKSSKSTAAAAPAAPTTPPPQKSKSTAAAASTTPTIILYTLLHHSFHANGGIAIFREAGARWTRETRLTRRDLLDIVEQLEFIHGANYVHCDVANRNMIQFVESDGTQRSVLIDFGAAIKHGETSLGGTVYNAPVSWLETNWRILSSADARVLIDKLTPMTAADDLVCFAWAVIDLRVDNVDLADVVAHRKELLQIASVAAVLKAAEERQYTLVAAKLADMLFLPQLPRSGSSPPGIKSERPIQSTPVQVSRPSTTEAKAQLVQPPMRTRSRRERPH